MNVKEERGSGLHCQPLSASQLEKLGVRLLNKYQLSLECLACGEVWTPTHLPDGALPRGYWKCPNQCN